MALKDLNNFENNKVISEENIVIGSGAGGSTIAHELVKKGKNVLILEEGPDVKNIKNNNIGFNITKLYKNAGVTPMIPLNSGPMIGYGQGNCLGGSTYVNAGYFAPTPEWVFDRWIKLNRTYMKYKEYLNFIDEIRKEISINTEENRDEISSKFLLSRSKKLKWKINKCERFSTGLDGNPKQSMNLTYHKKIINKGSDIIFNCKLSKILTKNDKAEKLVCFDNKHKRKFIFKFKNLFMNCGPVYTPFILKKNNLIKESFNKFEFHINFKVVVKFKEQNKKKILDIFDPNISPSIYFMREFENEGVLLSCANQELPYILATCAHFNDELKKDIVQNRNYYAMFIYQIKSNSLGKIKSFMNNPFISYSYDNEDNIQIEKAIKRLTVFFLENNADFILYPILNSSKIKNIKESNSLINTFYPKDLQLVSVHGMSSLRFGIKNGDIDETGKLKNIKNIFINDSSILPGNTSESPQATIMAFSKYTSKFI